MKTLSRTALFHAPWLDYSGPTLSSLLDINGELRHGGEPTGLRDDSVELSILISSWLNLEALGLGREALNHKPALPHPSLVFDERDVESTAMYETEGREDMYAGPPPVSI